MVENEDAEKHRHHLASNGDGDEGERAVEGEGGEDEELSDRTGEAEKEDVGFDGGVRRDEREGRGEFVGVRVRAECRHGEQEGGSEGEGEDEGGEGDEGGKDVHPEHHLRTIETGESAEDVVLRCVGDSVEEEVDGEEDETDQTARLATGSLARFRRLERHERPDSRRDESDESVLVERVFATVEEDVHRHNGDEFARLAEEEGWEGDVGEGEEAEGSGGGGDEGDEGVEAEEAGR